MEGIVETKEKPPSLREVMPLTARWVDDQRQRYGVEHVNACIKAALSGAPGLFYAMEAGHVLGTPFPATHPIASEQTYALLTGCKFAAFIAHPRGTP